MKQIIQPFGVVDKKTKVGIVIALSLFFFLLFEVIRSPIIPAPSKIGLSLVNQLTSSEFWEDLFASFVFTLKGMTIAILITMVVVYSSTIPLFAPIADFISKCRYLTLTGLVFMFTVMTSNLSSLKMALLIFGIVPFFTTSFLSFVRSVPRIEIDKARVNRKSTWETLLEIIIVGKADMLLETVRQNFAIAWMMITTVEAYDMAGGGLGTMLIKKNRVLDLAPIFSTVIVVILMGVLFDWGLSRLRYSIFPYVEKKK